MFNVFTHKQSMVHGHSVKPSDAWLMAMVLLWFPNLVLANHSNLNTELSGIVMLDSSHTGPFYDKQDKQSSQFEVRQAKLAMKTRFGKNWKSKLQIQYDSDIADKDTIESNDIINDGYVDYRASKNFNIRLGKMKEISGFERQSSSGNVSAIERSMASNTFLTGRNAGIQVYDYGRKHGWAIGYFDESLLDKDNIQSINGRYYQSFNSKLAMAPQWLVGLNTRYQNLNNERIQFKSSGEINTADNMVRSGRFYAKHSVTTQLDVTILSPHWFLHASYIHTQIRQSGESGESGNTIPYQGGFVQLAYSLNGLYKLGKGKQTYLKQGWEFVSRISAIDLTYDYQDASNNQVETGNQASIILLGANYYDQSGFKYMASFMLPSISGQVNSLDQSGSAFSLRGQYRF